MNSFKKTTVGTVSVFLLALGLNRLAEKTAVWAIAGEELICESVLVSSNPTVTPSQLPIRHVCV